MTLLCIALRFRLLLLLLLPTCSAQVGKGFKPPGIDFTLACPLPAAMRATEFEVEGID